MVQRYLFTLYMLISICQGSWIDDLTKLSPMPCEEIEWTSAETPSFVQTHHFPALIRGSFAKSIAATRWTLGRLCDARVIPVEVREQRNNAVFVYITKTGRRSDRLPLPEAWKALEGTTRELTIDSLVHSVPRARTYRYLSKHLDLFGGSLVHDFPSSQL